MRIADCGLRIVGTRSVAIVLSLSACSSSPPLSQNLSPSAAGVRPGDVISVKVWREPDYSGDFAVDARGRVTLPVLGEMAVQGRSAEAVSESLKTAFRRYLTNPSIEINVQRRIAVLGEVARPGLILADATISIGELVALAGGVTQLGNQRKIQLVRNNQVIISELGPGTILQRSPVQSGDQVFVPQRSWLSRNGQIFIYSAVSITGSIIVALLVRR